MRVAKNDLEDGLQDLADFMNRVTPKTTADQWRKWCTKRGPFKGWWTTLITDISGGGQHGDELRMTLEEAQQLRATLHYDLAFLREPQDTPLARILLRLNELQQTLYWQIERLSPASQLPKRGTVLEFGVAKKGRARWWVQSWPNVKTKGDVFYSVLGEAIRQGSIVRLMVCPFCARYFVRKDLKMRFCSEPHRIKFFNREKKRTKKHKEYRAMKRDKMSRLARRLYKERDTLESIKATVERIMGKTDLPPRVLKKVLGLDESIG